MFDVDKNYCLSTTDRLLFDINERLKLVNKALEKNTVQSEQTVIEDKKVYVCKQCGASYTNKGDLLVCARKHKKEGANNAKADNKS